MTLYLNFYNIGQQSALRVWSLKTDYRVFDKVTISEKIGVGQFSTTKTGQFWTTINKLYDLGRIKIISTTEAIFRAILVDTKQHPFGKKRVKKKHIRYAIIENLAIELSASALYEFYHGRQTIENFFKESKNPFNSGKMPSQKFRANEAYLQFVTIAYNCYSWFKKNFFHQPGKLTLWKPQELN